jgi:hypothetical protein
MTIPTLWVFGDSYSTPGVAVEPCYSYWGLTARALKIKNIRNLSHSGNSFDSVAHLLVSHQDEYNWDTDVFLIGIPPLERITVFDNHQDTAYHGHAIDSDTWDSTRFQVYNHHGLICLQNFGEDRTFITHSDRSWTETQAMRNIFFLTKWLDSVNAKYLIINHSKSFDVANVWGPTNFLLPYCQQHPRCILFDRTYHSVNQGVNHPADYDTYGWYGHHGKEGNQCFFEQSLLPRMQANNLIDKN